MELSWPVVVQHHGHLTLTLDFEGQILKMLYLRNERADWHGMKGMWIDRMLHPLCDFQRSPHPWPWPWIFKVKFWKSHISGMGWPIDMELKGCESVECWTHAVTFNGHLTHDLYLGFSRSNFEKVVSQEWDGRLTWNEKGCESIGCCIYFVTFNVHLTHDLDLGFSRSNFENAVSQEWEGRLTWNEKDLSRQNVGPMLWLSMFTSSMTLTLDFQGQILKKLYFRNGMADWHGRKGCESIECYTHIVTSNFDLTHDLDLGFSRLNIEIAVI